MTYLVRERGWGRRYLALNRAHLGWTDCQRKAARFDRREAHTRARALDAVVICLRSALRAEVARLRAALEEADTALACGSCAEDERSCPDHGDMHAKITETLRTTSPQPGSK